MKFYYSAKVPDVSGNITVYADSCKSLPDVLDRVYIGIFPNSILAIKNAQQKLQLSKVKICKCCI